VHEVGPKVAEAIRQFFDQPQNRRMIETLRAAGVTMRAARRETRETDGPFRGLTCVVTGTIPGRSRDDVKRILKRQGARVSEAISRKTDVLIYGEEAGSKLKKARALGVRLVDAEEFLRLVGADG
jgi:DNA ligase (NAD+)